MSITVIVAVECTNINTRIKNILQSLERMAGNHQRVGRFIRTKMSIIRVLSMQLKLYPGLIDVEPPSAVIVVVILTRKRRIIWWI
jgi:hypothetical protein